MKKLLPVNMLTTAILTTMNNGINSAFKYCFIWLQKHSEGEFEFEFERDSNYEKEIIRVSKGNFTVNMNFLELIRRL